MDNGRIDDKPRPLRILLPEQFDTAAEHVCTDIPRATRSTTAGEVRALLVGHSYESIEAVAVLDGDYLVGLVHIEKVMPAPDGARIGDLMDGVPPIVTPNVDQEEVAWRATRHGRGSIAVVDDQDVFLGLIPRWKLLEIMLEEHNEDIARLSGFLGTAAVARTASQESVRMRVWHRIPWLAVGLIGTILAAQMLGQFEATLTEHVILAFFLPGIVYMADAIGTQSEAIIIRGLSVGVPIRRMVWREILTGIVVGALLSILFFLTVLIGWGNQDAALVIGLALFAASSIASSVALLLPWILNRFDVDPAFGSGPLATVIQDILSLLIYLLIAVIVLG